MKKFRYRLERILKYREVVKEEKQRVLRIAQQKLASAKETLANLENELMTQRIEPGAVMNVNELELIGSYTEALRLRIIQETIEIEKIAEEVAVALADYIESAKDAASLEKHRDRKRGEYTELIEKDEQKFLDELTTQRSAKRVGLK